MLPSFFNVWNKPALSMKRKSLINQNAAVCRVMRYSRVSLLMAKLSSSDV